MVLCLQSCLRFTRGGFCRKDAQRRQCYFCRTVARLRDFAWFVLTRSGHFATLRGMLDNTTRPRFTGQNISLSADHLATLRALAAKDRRKSLSEVVQILIEREAERLLKE